MTTIRVPDIGEASNVTAIEIAVSTRDQVSEGHTLIVLESDNASMDIPAHTPWNSGCHSCLRAQSSNRTGMSFAN
jgi:Pyruvate/2-oxoglutarate dehydrogenase complex, dihydrolipoamide acyltransferase (E2) component, and related enzymes